MKVFILALFVAAAVAAPAPLEEEIGEPVEFIVNGVVEGEPLELGNVLDLKVKEHVDGQIVSSTNLLHPLTAEGLAEAAAAAALDPTPEEPIEGIQTLPEVVEIKPVPVELPAPVLPEVVPESVVLPAPALPELIPEPAYLPRPVLPEIIPQPVEIPAPALPEVIPQPIEIPAPALPEVIPEPVELPAPAVPEIIPEPVELPAPALPEVIPAPVEALPVPAPQLPTGEVFNDGVVQVTVNAAEPGVLSTLQSWFNMVVNYFNDGTQTTHQIV